MYGTGRKLRIKVNTKVTSETEPEKLLEQNYPGLSDREKIAVTMVTFGGLLSMHPSIVSSLDEAMKKFASLQKRSPAGK